MDSDQSPFRSARVRLVLFFVTGIGASILLAYLAEDWFGARAWRNYVAQAKAKGEWVEPADLIPPPVPDEQNFASLPLFKPLYDYTRAQSQNGIFAGTPVWRDPAAKQRLEDIKIDGFPSPTGSSSRSWRKGEFFDLAEWQKFFWDRPEYGLAGKPGEPAEDILRALGKFRPDLEPFRAGAARPYCRFPVRFEEGFSGSIPHLLVFLNVSKILRLRTFSELATGNSQAAAEDLQLQLRLTADQSPTLVAFLHRITLMELAMSELWEGLERHQWDDSQLAKFDSILAKTDLISAYRNAIEAERSFFTLPLLEQAQKNPSTAATILNSFELNAQSPWNASLARLIPSGLYDFNKIAGCQIYELKLAAVNPGHHRFFPEIAAQNASLIQAGMRGLRGLHDGLFVKIVVPVVDSICLKAAVGQSTLDHARVAIALERYRLAHGDYPATLAELTPALLGHVPKDVVTGASLHYNKQGTQSYQLYSVGWNGKDDGGKMAWKTPGNSSPDWAQGDWVWPRAEARK